MDKQSKVTVPTPRWVEGDKVLYDGQDPAVFAPAGRGVIVSDNGKTSTVEFKREGANTTYMQEVENTYLYLDPEEPDEVDGMLPFQVYTEDDDSPFEGTSDRTDPREELDPEVIAAYEADIDVLNEQAKALRASLTGIRLIVSEDAQAYRVDGELDDVYYDGETEVTMLAWDDDRGPTDEDGYDEEQNFLVVDDDGLVQAVGIDYTVPVDPEGLAALTLKVGQEFAERRGIVPGATVWLPPTSIEALLLGVGTVESVEDGLAVVTGSGLTLDVPAFLLRVDREG